MTTHNRRPPNAEEKLAAERVRKHWLNSKKELGLTQERAAELLGWSQGTFNAYLNARVPMPLSAALKFAKLLNVPAVELAPEIVAQHGEDVLDIERTGYSDLPPIAQANIKTVVDMLLKMPIEEINYITKLVEMRAEILEPNFSDGKEKMIKPQGDPVMGETTLGASRKGKKAG